MDPKGGKETEMEVFRGDQDVKPYNCLNDPQ